MSFTSKILLSFIAFCAYYKVSSYPVKYYSPSEYASHPYNYDIIRANNGIVHLANFYGVISFDGHQWKKTALPNGKSAHSIGIDQKGKIYVGSYFELGYLESNNQGIYKYHSILPLIPSERKEKVDQIFKTIGTYQGAYYFGFHQITYFENNQVKMIQPPVPNSLFQYATQLDTTIYVHIKNKGIHIIRKNELVYKEGTDILKDSKVWGISLLGNDTLLIASESGFYYYTSGNTIKINEGIWGSLNPKTIIKFCKASENTWAIGTNNNGIIITDRSGNIIQNANVQNGLGTNGVVNLFNDEQGFVWACFDKGIASIDLFSPGYTIDSGNNISGMGYTAALNNDLLYLGTSQGVYYGKFNKKPWENKFQFVKQTKGQIWQLINLDGEIFCCHAEHLFKIKNGEIQVVRRNGLDEGCWKIMPLKKHPNYALLGTYNGFELFKKEKEGWKFQHVIQGFNETSKIFQEDQYGNIWMCHGNKGLFKLTLSQDLKKFTSTENISLQQNIHSNFFYEVFLFQDEIYFGSKDGVYRYDSIKKILLKDEIWKDILKENSVVEKIYSFDQKSFWSFNGKDAIYYIHQNNRQWIPIQPDWLSNQVVGSFEFVLNLPNNNFLIGTQNGYAYLNINDYHNDLKKGNVLLRRISSINRNDSLLFDGANWDTKNSFQFDYSYNSLRITFADPILSLKGTTEYRYSLTPVISNKKNWSAWNTVNSSDLNNIYEGEYILYIQSRGVNQQIINEGLYPITILAPWYRHPVAYIVYGILILLSLYIFYLYTKKKITRQRLQIERERENQILLLQQQILTENLQKENQEIELKKERLEYKLAIQNNELSTLASGLTKQSSILSALKEKLQQNGFIQKSTEQSYKEIIKTIDEIIKPQEEWSTFQKHFDEAHNFFLQRLKKQFPDLNESWLVLCAFIRMNKSNKEISSALNISPAAVEKRKYRLRDKLNLASEDKVQDFLINF